MKWWFALLMVWYTSGSSIAQTVYTPSFELQVSRQQLHLNDTLTAVFVIENGGDTGRFQPPDWDGVGLTVVEGPDFSTEVVMRGDVRTYTLRYQYVVQPFETGDLKIPYTMYKVGSTIYRTKPVTLKVEVTK
jgi:BatD DUF11 like domain